MADHRFLSSAPVDPYDTQWRESVLSTRSLSYVSNAGSIIHPHSLAPGAQIRQTSSTSFRTPSRKNTADTMHSSEEGDLEMVDARRTGSVGLPEISELPDSVANSLLYSLPREIRDRIFAFVLSPKDGLPVEWPRPTQFRLNSPYDLQPQLLRTCKIVHDEAAPLLYTMSSMTFHHPSDANVFVRAFASPIYGRQITNLSLHIKAQDSRTWMPYLTSTDEIRSLRADFPNLRELGVRFRSNKWHHQHTPEQNMRAWCDDSRLDELTDGLRHVFLPSEQPEREVRGREFQTFLTSNPAAFRDGDPDQLRDRLLKIHKARLDRTSSTTRRTEAPTIRVCCACRVHSTHFNALTTRATEPLQEQAAAAQNGDPMHPPRVPVQEGEPFRGFTAVDLQNGVKQLHDPELGSANVARTPYTSKNGILLALEIHCLDPKRDAAERAA
ncbi:hypothetical protein HII31_00675 [Pseudocercospora fuligena]|uniref:F-box domain-containing protein n=1 Tax=Pseudocercospora fuligena TaxID=685502 RepID=A0A8H6RXF9_9PEZI|nr:hypothetical protein HII31_00675 [Pseudocercospora fuligena]